MPSDWGSYKQRGKVVETAEGVNGLKCLLGIGVIVRYFRNFHHVTLGSFDVYLHAWLFVYNMERRGVRFDQIYDEIDACLV